MEKWVTDSFFDLAELLETLAEGVIVGMPRQAAGFHEISVMFPSLWDRKIPDGDFPHHSSARGKGLGKSETNILDEKLGHFGRLLDPRDED